MKRYKGVKTVGNSYPCYLQVPVRGKAFNVYLGSFDDPDKAAEAYDNARFHAALMGFFRRTNWDTMEGFNDPAGMQKFDGGEGKVPPYDDRLNVLRNQATPKKVQPLAMPGSWVESVATLRAEIEALRSRVSMLEQRAAPVSAETIPLTPGGRRKVSFPSSRPAPEVVLAPPGVPMPTSAQVPQLPAIGLTDAVRL